MRMLPSADEWGRGECRGKSASGETQVTMETAAVRLCPQCGHPASSAESQCRACDTPFVTASLSILAQIGDQKVRSWQSFYKQHGDDPACGFLVGMCFLKLRQPDFALKSLEKTLEAMPENPEIYYHMAVASIGLKKPKLLTRAGALKVEQYLNTAVQLDERQSKYHLLLGVVKHDFYELNGLRSTDPKYADCISTALTVGNYQDDEVRQMAGLVPVTDATLAVLSHSGISYGI